MPNCILCHIEKTYTSSICRLCLVELPWNIHYCQQCALPSTDGIVDSCSKCINTSPLFSEVRSAFCYHFPINRLITTFKDKGNLPLGKCLARLLAQSLLDGPSLQHNPPEILLPVPSHPKSVNQRGYNPAHVIAKFLAKKLSIPMANDLLIKHKHSSEQKSLTASERQVNLKNTFSTSKKGALALPNYYRVALIDDIVTTGSTANALAEVLLRAGVKDVVVWCVARTP